MDEFGKRLKYLREQQELPLSKLAEAIGSTKSALSRYENGKVEPGLRILKRLTDYFGVTLDWLCGNGSLDDIEFSDRKAYDKVIDKCIQKNISVDKLEQFVDLLGSV